MTKSRGINKPKANWTVELDDRLRSLYPHNTAAVVGEIIGMRIGQIYSRAKRLGIEKSNEFKASDKSGRVQRGLQDPRMVATRFQAGLKPWNKGTHYVAGGRSAETRFQKGRKPEESRNYLPIGSLRVSADGYLERKVSDDQSVYPARRWNFVHRLVWEASHGPIPTGHLVVFRRGMFTNKVELLTVDRLECITRAENAHRNSIWRSDPELAYLYQLKGAITRHVNRIRKEAP